MPDVATRLPASLGSCLRESRPAKWATTPPAWPGGPDRCRPHGTARLSSWVGRCRADRAPLVYLFPLPYSVLGACDTVIPAVPPAIAGRAMWGPASAGWEPPPRAFPFPFPRLFQEPFVFNACTHTGFAGAAGWPRSLRRPAVVAGIDQRH